MASDSERRKSHISGDQNVFLLQFQYKTTLANCNKASIKKLITETVVHWIGLFQTSIQQSGRWVIILKFQEALLQATLNLLKTDVSRGPPGLSGWPGPGPSGPTVIRPLGLSDQQNYTVNARKVHFAIWFVLSGVDLS